jgi:hypothetical protein
LVNKLQINIDLQEIDWQWIIVNVVLLRTF